MWAQLSFVLSQITRLTDGQTTFSWLDRVMPRGKKLTAVLTDRYFEPFY